MKIKTEFVGEDWGYYVIRDESAHYNDILKYDGGIEEANRYFAEGEFESRSNIDGTYAAGILESIGQSDNCPPQLYTENCKIIVTILK